MIALLGNDITLIFLSSMNELEMQKLVESRPCEVMILSNPPHIYFATHDNMSSRQRRRHERTRMRKGRK